MLKYVECSVGRKQNCSVESAVFLNRVSSILSSFLARSEPGGINLNEAIVQNQRNIFNDREISELTAKFTDILEELHKQGKIRHGLAAMAQAMQQVMTYHDYKGVVAHTESLELIMRGVYTTITGTGAFDYHPVDKLTQGYLGLMLKFNKDRHAELYKSFQVFSTLLHKR